MRLLRHIRPHLVEAAIGLVLAVIVVVTAWASSGEVPFVYRGL